jgi:hypothetical protein
MYLRLYVDEFEWIWMNLNEFEWIWMNLNEFEWIWMNLNEFEWIWMNLNEFEWIWLSQFFQEIGCNDDGLIVVTKFSDPAGPFDYINQMITLNKWAH